MNGLRFKVGDRVRFIGQDRPFQNIVNLMLVGHDGTIERAAEDPRYDWYVRLDEGAYDIEAMESTLEKLDPPAAPKTMTVVEEVEV